MKQEKRRRTSIFNLVRRFVPLLRRAVPGLSRRIPGVVAGVVILGYWSVYASAAADLGASGPKVWRPRAGSCQSIFWQPAVVRPRIYSMWSYPIFSKEYDIASARREERSKAEEKVDPVFHPQRIRLEQLQNSLREGRAELASIENKTENNTIGSLSPLRSSLVRVTEYLQNKKFVSSLSKDSLVIFLMRSYEMQNSIRTKGTQHWNTWESTKLEQLASADAADLLTEIKSIVWRELFSRGQTVESVEQRINDFYDIDVGGIGYISSDESKRNAVLEQLDVDRKTIFLNTR